MLFAFTEEQRAFRDAVREFLEKESTPQDVRRASTDGLSRDRWKRLAELGVVGMLAPVEDGGLGMNEVDMVILLEETGRACLPEPIVETALVAIPALAARNVAKEQRVEVVAGGAIVSVAFGEPFVAHAASADYILVYREDRVALVARSDIQASPQPNVDPTRPLATVTITGPGVTLAEGSDARAIADLAFDRVVLGMATQLLGVTERCIEMAAAYAKERHQFGRAIGTFQAVKHRLADAYVALEFARPVVYRAADSLARNVPERSRDVSMAKALASDAALIACKAALQVHGAIGYTEEHDLHLWLRRGFALASAWGDAARHRARLGHGIL